MRGAQEGEPGGEKFDGCLYGTGSLRRFDCVM